MLAIWNLCIWWEREHACMGSESSYTWHACNRIPRSDLLNCRVHGTLYRVFDWNLGSMKTKLPISKNPTTNIKQYRLASIILFDHTLLYTVIRAVISTLTWSMMKPYFKEKAGSANLMYSRNLLHVHPRDRWPIYMYIPICGFCNNGHRSPGLMLPYPSRG